jgi:hypothetical protein
MIRLSKASKMPCLSWSLEARTHCPASLIDGELVDACKGCYAAGGNYRFPNVRAPRLMNAKDWKRAGWVDDMVTALEGETHFRWFDSGDVAWLALARKIQLVMIRTPNTQHWLPTRMHRFPKFRPVLSEMRTLSNVVVRLSSDSIEGEHDARLATGSTIFSDPSQLPDHATVCGAYKRDGKCGDCRACWDTDNKLIAYPAHGRVMLKLIDTLAA